MPNILLLCGFEMSGPNFKQLIFSESSGIWHVHMIMVYISVQIIFDVDTAVASILALFGFHY